MASPTAGILTLAVFGGLTFSVFVTRKDYSSLRPVLCVGSWIALGVIVAGCLIGFGLGRLFGATGPILKIHPAVSASIPSD